MIHRCSVVLSESFLDMSMAVLHTINCSYASWKNSESQSQRQAYQDFLAEHVEQSLPDVSVIATCKVIRLRNRSQTLLRNDPVLIRPHSE